LNRYANWIETNIQEQEQNIQLQLKEATFIQNRYQKAFNDIHKVEEFSNYPFNICLYEKDSLIFWSKAIAFLDKEYLQQLKNTSKPIFKKLSNGYFVIQKHELPYLKDENKFAVSLIPVKWIYSEQVHHLTNAFEAGGKNQIPLEIEVSLKETPYPVQSIDEIQLFHLHNTANFRDKSVLKWVLFFYLIGFVLLGFVINIIARKLIYHYKPWVGPAFLLFTVFGLRYISLDWSANFQVFQVFSRTFDNPHVSVGDLLINIILLLWVVIFIHRESQDKEFNVNFSKQTRMFLTCMNYLSVVLALLLLISVLKSLVINSGIDFDFKNVFSLDQYSIFAVFGVILLLFTQFVFSHRMMITIHKLNLNRKNRLIALSFAIILALPIIYLIDLQIPLLHSALVSFIFVLAYDLFIDIPNPGLIWLAGWVILFAGFSSSLLYTYNQEKEIQHEIFLAKELADNQDSLAEKALIEFKEKLDFSSNLYNFDSIKSKDYQKSIERIAAIAFQQNYLYTNYDYTLHIYNEKGENIAPVEQQLDLEDWQAKLTTARPLTAHSNIYFSIKEEGKFVYYLFKKFPNKKTGASIPQFIFEFHKAPRRLPKVYSNLLFRKTFKGLKNLDQYGYAIIKNGQVMTEQGFKEPPFDKEPAIGSYEKTGHLDLVHFIYRSAEKDYVILSKAKNNLFQPISLFCSIFVFLTIMVLIFAVINSKLNILPDGFNFKFWNKPSLKNRIQFHTIAITLVSFIIISFVSFYFLTDSYRSYDKNRLKRKVSGVQTSAEQYLHLEKDSLFLLKKHISELAEAQRIDVNLFDLKGQLIQSSEMDVFRRGIIPFKMNSEAFEYLEKMDKSDLIQIEERISEAEFVSGYVPITDSESNKVAYLGVPYSNQQRNLKDDVLNFMGNLLNVYVFLLIIAGAISVYVANTITKPISTLGENLKELKLGKPNEPLEWRTNDEIGALITEYNRMILKLEHSAKLLARSEREGAWREMAKQVAHEIKNPLTPMKLSIQYLTHAFKSNPENIEPLLKRVSNTLIEQIDSLAQIASEFSNFAKMPRANNQQIKLNDLVESVHDLFKKSKNTDILLSLPENDFYVFADKNHLMRVLNNMIKNAVEAIPDSREGKINVSLYQVGQMATIKVEDNGVGIPEEMQSKVFVPNFTTKNSGTGLGLAISKNIIESVSGKIYFETEKNIGTSFFVELPLEEMII
jgi:signal transduction histidine kinase